MLNQRYAEASVEVLDILEHMNANDLAKVSNKFIEFLKENASKNYICNLDYSKKLNDMELKQETRGLLALMYEKYWCPEEEKDELQKRFYENEQKYQTELREKYNPDNLFKNKNGYSENIEGNILEEIAMVEYKQKNFIQKLFDKIRNLFKRN